MQPFLETAAPLAGAVVVDHALRPDAAQLGIEEARHERRILDRNAALIIVAVERPGLNLALGELAVAHQRVKRVPVVVTFGADLAQPGFEVLTAVSGHDSVNAMPS